ncbi:MAG: LPS assembly lipoprotein LptE [Jannaschia sp.]
MSWSRRALLGPACAAMLMSCGFAPVYGPTGEGAALRGSVRIADPENDVDFAFLARMEERLGAPAAPRYDLTYGIVTAQEALAIDGSNNITRFNIEGRIAWQLTPLGAEAPTLLGTDAAFTSYSATGSTISTLESERDAERRLAVILADKVVTRLLADAGGL